MNFNTMSFVIWLSMQKYPLVQGDKLFAAKYFQAYTLDEVPGVNVYVLSLRAYSSVGRATGS